MCMSCGCKQPSKTHGDDRNITLRDIEAAAAAAGTDIRGVIKNFKQTSSSSVPAHLVVDRPLARGMVGGWYSVKTRLR